MSEVVALCGNGLTFDFIDWLGVSLADWDPRSPTKWKEAVTLADGRELLPLLPAFSTFVTEQRAGHPEMTDFEIFDALLRRPPPVPPDQFWGTPAYKAARQAAYEHDRATEEARHFLVGCFAQFHEALVKSAALKQWRWARWFYKMGDRLTAVASFNYDLLVESTLSSCGMGYRRPMLCPQEPGPTLIYKPHGSIDFQTSEQAVSAPIEYPLRNLFNRLDVPIVKATSLRFPRLDAQLVLPAEASQISDYQWVTPARSAWLTAASRADHVVVAGLSYWGCDRDELDDLLAAAPDTAEVHLCNPNPNGEWTERLRGRFGAERVHLAEGPPEFD